MTKGLAIFVFACLLVFSGNASARNPGKNAMDCVSVSQSGTNNSVVKFTNRCNERIFILWCGELKHSKNRCGDGPKKAGNAGKSAGYYTHSSNIDPGRDKTVTVAGRYRYAACVGGISFGNDGEYVDDSSGGFSCLKR